MFNSRKRHVIYVSVLLASVILGLSLVSPLRSPLLNTLRLPLIIINVLKRQIQGIFNYRQNLREKERLSQEIAILKNSLLGVEEIVHENMRLKKILDLKESSAYHLVAARIIGRSADNWSSVLILDKGANKGIQRGYVVIHNNGLVGRVIQTTDLTSKVILINDTRFSVSAQVKRNRQEGLVTGMLGNKLMMRYLPRDADIKVEDQVITSGFTDLYPKGLMIGKIVDMADEVHGLTRYAVIETAVDLFTIEEVLVIIP